MPTHTKRCTSQRIAFTGEPFENTELPSKSAFHAVPSIPKNPWPWRARIRAERFHSKPWIIDEIINRLKQEQKPKCISRMLKRSSWHVVDFHCCSQTERCAVPDKSVLACWQKLRLQPARSVLSATIVTVSQLLLSHYAMGQTLPAFTWCRERSYRAATSRRVPIAGEYVPLHVSRVCTYTVCICTCVRSTWFFERRKSVCSVVSVPWFPRWSTCFALNSAAS